MKKSEKFLKLLSLAKISRKKFEMFAIHERANANLAGYCGIASKHLQLAATKENIFPEYVCGIFNSYNRITSDFVFKSHHSWVEFENTIIDITATQFRHTISNVNRDFNTKIYTSNANNPHYQKKYIGKEADEECYFWYEEELVSICERVDYVNSFCSDI